MPDVEWTETEKLAHDTYTELCDMYSNGGNEFIMRGAFEIFLEGIIFKEKTERLIARRNRIYKSIEQCITRK